MIEFRAVIWWAMRKLGVEKWAVRVVQSMYIGAKSRERINNQLSDEFGVNVGVHQGSVLSPILFILVLEALSRELRTGVPWELLYADDLVLISESLDDCIYKFEKWKLEIESKGLRVNKKTKFMLLGSKNLRDSGAFPCSVCRKGVGVNSVLCSTCSHWVHKRCIGLTGRLKDQAYVCPRCLNLAIISLSKKLLLATSQWI